MTEGERQLTAVPGSGGPTLEPAEAGERSQAVLAEVEKVIVGKPEAIRLMLLAILAGGHVLVEDLPGVGKTLLARTFAAVFGLDFTRVQFTPDLLPADLTGASIYDQRSREFVFRPGPVFTQVLLADEINRTPPKTQAALLEAMGEQQVSVDGRTRPLPQPFVVLATNNPIEYEGTYPLPEAQLDRFSVRIRLGYLTADGEAEMVQRRLARGAAPPVPERRVTTAELLAMRASVEQVRIDADLLRYVVELVGATRANPQVVVGASPRGTLAIVQLARARAVVDGRDYVIPEDIREVTVPALGHRLSLRPELWVRGLTGDDIVGQVMRGQPMPRAGTVGR